MKILIFTSSIVYLRMIRRELVYPESIVVIGGSENPHTPGGKVLANLLENKYSGKLYVVNKKRKEVRGLPVFQDVSLLPTPIDLAIIAVPARFVEETLRVLAEEKGVKAFIVFSAGFSDLNEEGKKLEKRLVKIVENVGGSLLGPNNIGLMNPHYAGVFTTPVPPLQADGTDLISASGATAVFILEAAMQIGLRFNSVWSVGNSAQIGIEEVLEYLDSQYTENTNKVIMLYIESIRNPEKLLRSALSLYRKGCRIVAVKSGISSAGSRAASSHTGALSSSDLAVSTLFEKAGIIRAEGRNEMILIAGILQYGLPQGKNMAIVTHAGGPAVMLTDTLEKNGFIVPEFQNPEARELLKHLYLGSSVKNPIDFLATGTAEQLDIILSYVTKFEEIDAVSVIFGSPGLFPVFEVYDVLGKHIERSPKPIYPVLPSVVNVAEEIKEFHKKGFPSFPEETLFAKALAKAYFSSPAWEPPTVKTKQITLTNQSGYLSYKETRKLLEEFGFPLIDEEMFTSEEEALAFAKGKFPVVLKVVGILHKSDVGGVRLNITDAETLRKHFRELMRIPGAKGVLVQRQMQGIEMFAGVKYEENFGHLILFGAGGIYIELFKDFASVLFPASKEEIHSKLKKLKSYALLEGIRGAKRADIASFIELIYKINELLVGVPAIRELDFNPVLVNEEGSFCIDVRIRVED